MDSFEWLLAIASWAISCNSFFLQNTNQTKALAPELNILVQIFTVHKLLLIPTSRDQASQVLAPRFSYPQRAVLPDPSESWLQNCCSGIFKKGSPAFSLRNKLPYSLLAVASYKKRE